MKRHHIIQLESRSSPIVELDSEAHAAYVRFSTNKVARTEPVSTMRAIVTIDFDEAGAVVGVELVGVTDFTIEKLLEKAGFRHVPKEYSQNTRYVPASLQPA